MFELRPKTEEMDRQCFVWWGILNVARTHFEREIPDRRALAGVLRADFRKETIMLFENLSPIADNRILRLSH